MKKYYLLMLLFFGFEAIQAQETLIPDSNFEQALINYEYDDILDGKVLTANISGITYLDIGYINISNLTGIQDFVSLQYLFCNNNQLTNINVNGLTNLQYLFCNGNQLTNLDVSALINLNYLNCADNQITNLNISGLTNLNQLVCNSNLLTNLNLNGLTNLNLLYCQANQLSTLDLRGISNINIMFCYANLDLSCISVDDVSQADQNIEWSKDSFTSYNLDCSITPAYTFIPDPDFEQALIDNGYDDTLEVDGKVLTDAISGVTYLNLAYSRYISDLTGIQDFVALQSLTCDNNRLTSLDVSGLTNLQTLSCQNNELSNLNLSGLTNLASLTCNNNQLTSLNLSGLTNLASLTCNFNKLTSLDLRGLTSLSNLNSKYNEDLSCISVDYYRSGLPTSWEVDLHTRYSLDCSLPTTLIPDRNFEQVLINDGYDFILDGKVITVHISDITYLNLNNSNISDLTGIQDFISLEYLTCENNYFTNLDVSGLTNLQALSCQNNILTNLNLSGCTNLASLECNNNALTSLNLSGLTNLLTLDCTNNQMTSLDLRGLTSLSNLHSTSNPDLNCISVDNVEQANQNNYNNWYKDDETTFSLDCEVSIEAVIAGTTSICTEDIANLNVEINGGTAPYTVVYTDGVTNFTVSSYVSGTPIPVTPNVNTTYTLVSVTDTNSNLSSTNSGSAIITIITTVEPTFSQVEAICEGGSLAELPTTSNNGISGIWSPELNSFETTEYTFTPADDQCATTATMTIVVNPNTSSTESVTACDSYTWLLNNQTYTASGTYKATGSNATGCLDTKTLVLTINRTPIVDVIQPPSTCEGLVQSILTNVTARAYSVSLWTATNGGTIVGGNDNPFMLNISTAGTYMLTVTNGSCVASDSVTAVYNPIVTPTFTAVAPICEGGSLAELPTTSNNGISGTWSPALNNEATTEYTFTPSNGECAVRTSMTITVNQCSQVFCSGATVSSLTPSGADIKWYASATSTTPLLATSVLTTKTYFYTRTVEGEVSTRTPSDVVINPTSVAGSITGASGTICYNTGKILALSTTARGSVQWQSSISITGPFVPIFGATTRTLNTGDLPVTTYFNAVLTSGVCPSRTTATATITVRPQANTGIIAGGGVSVCTGTNKTVLTLSGQVGTIQWQSSTNNVDFTSLPAKTAVSFTATNLTTTTYYRVMVTNGTGCSPAFSNSVAVIVKALPVSGTITGISPISYNTAATLSLVGYEVGSSLQWRYSTLSTGTYFSGNIANSTSEVYTTSRLTRDYYYKVSVTKDGCTSTSAPFLVDVSSRAKIGDVNSSSSSTPFEVIAYPNPSSESFNIQTSGKGAINVRVYDMQGRLVENTDSTQFGSRLAAGIYNVIVNKGANTKSVRVIKK